LSCFRAEPAPRIVDLKAADGTPLKATYFAAAKSGPGVLLLHQNTRTPSLAFSRKNSAWVQRLRQPHRLTKFRSEC
jgi:hypothetical protein